MVSLLSIGKISLSSPCEIDLGFSGNPFTVIHNVISIFLSLHLIQAQTDSRCIPRFHQTPPIIWRFLSTGIFVD